MNNRIKAKARFVYKSKTTAEWQSENPILLNGEIGFVSDVNEGDYVKIGDGITHWNDLPYKRGPKGEKGEKGDTQTVEQSYNPQSENAQSGKAVAEAIKNVEVDIATPEKAGVVKADPNDYRGNGVCIDEEGFVKIMPANHGDIYNRNSDYIRPVTTETLDYAVKVGLANSKLQGDVDYAWDDTDKINARTLLNAVGKDDYATFDFENEQVIGGIVKARPQSDDPNNPEKYDWGLGLEVITDGYQKGYLQTKAANNGAIVKKEDNHSVITPANIDYAVLKALTDCKKTTWNDNEKSNARALLGALGTDALTNVLSKGAITTESYYEETHIKLEPSTLYVFIHNSGSNNIEVLVSESEACMSPGVGIDCSKETMPTFQAGAILVPKDISSPLKLTEDSQGNLTVYDYNDRTALLMGVTGKTLGVPQMATKQFYYDCSNSGDRANARVNYGYMFAHNTGGSLTVWKIKL